VWQVFRRSLAALLATAALALSAVAGAPAQVQDGLINVSIRNVLSGNKVVIRDVNVQLAAQIAAQVCGIKVGPLAILATQVDNSGDGKVACRAGRQVVIFRDN
jgi:hypothetical protein